jgi:hypothetical protein
MFIISQETKISRNYTFRISQDKIFRLPVFSIRQEKNLKQTICFVSVKQQNLQETICLVSVKTQNLQETIRLVSVKQQMFKKLYV